MPELTWLQDPNVLFRYALIQGLNGMPWWMPRKWAIGLARARAIATTKTIFPSYEP